jgi:formate C-acetyltransferase
MDDLLRAVEARLFQAQDSVCLERARLVTEAYREHTGEPMPILRARALEHVLAQMTLDMDSNPVYAGNTATRPRAWMLVPEFGFSVCPQIAIEHSELDGFLDGRIPDELRDYWATRSVGGNGGVGHMSLDWQAIVADGLEGLLARIEAALPGADEEQRAYLRGMGIACRAVIAWAGRYAEAADAAAQSASDPLVAACHRRVAEACRRVPARPARNLFEGLQAILLVHLATMLEGQGLSMSIGLLDRALAPFAAEAADDPDAAVALVRGFLLGVAANSFQGRGSKTQAITIGGADHRGHDCCNAVTLAVLEAFDRSPVADPHLFVRWHPDIDDTVLSKAYAMLSRGRSLPHLVSDLQVAPGLERAGVAPEDAWEYCIIGCNELGIPGRLCQTAISIGLGFDDLEVLDRATRRVAQEAESVDDLVAAYGAEVSRLAEAGLATRRERLQRLVERAPMPLSSACCRGTVEAGGDLLLHLPYSEIYGCYTRGTANAVNALAAMEREVFQGGMTLPEYVAAVDAGAPELLERIAAAPKWGTDAAVADRWAVRLNEARDHALRDVAERHALPPMSVCHVVRSLHHVDGRRMGATVDGRAAGAPVGDSVGPVQGTAAGGPTAALASVLKLRAGEWFSGIYNLNLTLPPEQGTPQIVRWLAEGFFQDGGQELQIAVLDPERLRAAQADPDAHRDLVVRVAGLNARFVELSRLEQEELIARAEGVAG